jgi:hypothetical protein
LNASSKSTKLNEMLISEETGELKFVGNQNDTALLDTIGGERSALGGARRISLVHQVLRERRPDLLSGQALRPRELRELRSEAAQAHLATVHGIELPPQLQSFANIFATTNMVDLQRGRSPEITLPSNGAALVVEYAFRKPGGDPSDPVEAANLTVGGLNAHETYLSGFPSAQRPENINLAVQASRSILALYSPCS